MKLNNIVIVGGGSAGFITATTLIRLFPNKKITLIESPKIPTVGVGESTTAHFKSWLSLVGIKDSDFMKECDATYKFGIRFTDFYKKDSTYFDYPFGKYNANFQANTWHVKKSIKKDTNVNDYAETFYTSGLIMKHNKIVKKCDGFDYKTDTGYQIDAVKFANWLRDNICIPEKVNYIKQTITNATVNDDGIEFLLLDDNTKIYGDLFIDCTGFSSLLLGKTMKEEFVSYEDMLPNNSAWTAHLSYKNKKRELVTYTNCTAIENGWVWNTPLWNSIGTGYVYSDKHVDDKLALEEFKKHLSKNKHDIKSLSFNNIKFRTGVYKRLFVKNVCAIGLSAGFIEPLESTGLLAIHEYILYLILLMDRDEISQWDKDTYNYSCRNFFNIWADFVALHFSLSLREDTNYWKDIKNKGITNDQNTIYQNTLHPLMFDKIYNNGYNTNSGMHFIATGMNWNPINVNSIKYANKDPNFNFKIFDDDIKSISDHKENIYNQIKNGETLEEFMSKTIYD